MKKLAGWAVGLLLAVGLFGGEARAGDGATIILKSGAVIYLLNGYQQIVDGMRTFNKKGDYNYYLQVNLENAPFFLNLGEVALVCRDQCRSLQIVHPKKEGKEASGGENR